MEWKEVSSLREVRVIGLEIKSVFSCLRVKFPYVAIQHLLQPLNWWKDNLENVGCSFRGSVPNSQPNLVSKRIIIEGGFEESMNIKKIWAKPEIDFM